MFFLIFSVLFGFQSHAGSRHIYCEGNFVQADMPAKGPRPSDKNFILRGIESGPTLQEISVIDGSDSFDFHIVYQSSVSGKNIVAVLRYLNSEMYLSVFKDAKIVEENILCSVGF